VKQAQKKVARETTKKIKHSFTQLIVTVNMNKYNGAIL
jgi:hypothetical protein